MPAKAHLENAGSQSLGSQVVRHLKSQRRFWLKVHLYSGLSLGLVLSVIGLTGSILVFWMEIDEFLNPALIKVRPKEGGAATYRSVQEMVDSARASLPPGAFVEVFDWPRHDGAAADCEVAIPNAMARAIDHYDVFVDPYTARVTGKRLWYSADNWWNNSFLGIIFKIHYALMIRSWGVYLVAILSLFFLALTLTGLYVWLPLSGKWRQALTLAWPNSYPRWNYEIHKATGFYACLILMIVLTSGIYLDAPDQFLWVLEHFSKASRPAVPLIQQPEKLPLTLDTAVAAVQQNFPRGKPYYMSLASDPKSIELTQMVPVGLGFMSRRIVEVDLSTGAIRHVSDPLHATFSTGLTQWQWPLHSGKVFGWPGRIMVFLSGLVCPVLLVTGFNRWLWKKRAHLRQRAHQTRG